MSSEISNSYVAVRVREEDVQTFQNWISFDDYTLIPPKIDDITLNKEDFQKIKNSFSEIPKLTQLYTSVIAISGLFPFFFRFGVFPFANLYVCRY